MPPQTQGKLFGLARYTTGSLNTAYRYTGQRIEDDAVPC